jgi:hypothetical protein
MRRFFFFFFCQPTIEEQLKNKVVIVWIVLEIRHHRGNTPQENILLYIYIRLAQMSYMNNFLFFMGNVTA